MWIAGILLLNQYNIECTNCKLSSHILYRSFFVFVGPVSSCPPAQNPPGGNNMLSICGYEPFPESFSEASFRVIASKIPCKNSIGIGKRIVEFFSADTSVRVCR